MSAANAARSYIVAASIATVEALKDQGFARWNYPLRNLHYRLKSSLRSPFSQSSKAVSSSSAASDMGSEITNRALNKTERNLKKVMEIDCFGPSTIRF
ncbi:Coenzyme PQQ synthesis protein B [Bienertia sinuspersici]